MYFGGKCGLELLAKFRLGQSQATTFMVAGNDNQGFAIAGRESERCSYRLVKISHFCAQPMPIVGVAGLINLTAFYHQKKSFVRAFLQKITGQTRGTW